MASHQPQRAAGSIVVIEDFVTVGKRLRTAQHRRHRDGGELGNALQTLLYLGGFVRQLVRVWQMLQVAATTAVVQWTRGGDAPGRRLAQHQHIAKSIPASVVRQAHIDDVTRGCTRHKHRQAIQMTHTIPAMRQPLDGECATFGLWLDLVQLWLALGRRFVYLPAGSGHRPLMYERRLACGCALSMPPFTL